MRDRVASLRQWLLGGGILLLVVIAAFVTYARLRSRFHHIKLPGKLGVNVVREAGGWTLSRSKGSKTLYTIHAAKLDQGRNGKSALHGVSITFARASWASARRPPKVTWMSTGFRREKRTLAGMLPIRTESRSSFGLTSSTSLGGGRGANGH